MAVGDIKALQTDGKAVDVTLSHTVTANQAAYVEGFLGFVHSDGDSGDTVAMNQDKREYQLIVPTALAVSKGDTIYIDVTDLTGHTPDSTAYYKAADTNRVAFMKATADQDANDVVTGILL